MDFTTYSDVELYEIRRGIEVELQLRAKRKRDAERAQLRMPVAV